jgi:hypothetical protein
MATLALLVHQVKKIEVYKAKAKKHIYSKKVKIAKY